MFWSNIRIPDQNIEPQNTTRSSQSPGIALLPDRTYGRDDTFLLLRGHLVVERQDERPVGEALGHGQRSMRHAGVCRLTMGGHDAPARRDLLLSQVCEQGLPVYRELLTDLDPKRLDVGLTVRRVLDAPKPRNVGYSRSIAVRKFAPAHDYLVEAPQLDDAHRCLQIGHPVVEAHLEVLLGGRE